MWQLPPIFKYITNIFESVDRIDKVVVVYPGRFQPFHRGHASVYHGLQKRFPSADVFVATSNVVEQDKSPFTFEQKKTLMVAAGVPARNIKQVKNPYVALEIMADYDLQTTAIIFAISEKDMNGNPRFSFKPKKDGSPSFFQPLKDDVPPSSATKHGYMTTIPTLKFKVNGEMVNSASQIREMFRVGNAQDRKRIIFDLYGKFVPIVYQTFLNALIQTQ